MNQQDEDLIRAYRLTFGSPSGQVVLNDLMKFCKFRTACENQLDEGKRQAFLHVMQFIALTPEQLILMYGGTLLRLDEVENG